MGKKVLILKGSPRERGNSAALAEQVAAGAREAGLQVDSISLQNMDIRACDGCDLCKETGEYCAIEDDMQALYPKLVEADAIVLASPIYWFTFSAQLKLCIDRWYGPWSVDNETFRGKSIGIVLTFGDTDVYTSGAINAIHTFESMFRFVHAPIVGMVYGSASDPGDAEKNPELMRSAYELGKKLAECTEAEPSRA